MNYTKGERVIYCGDDYWFVEVKNSKPVNLIGKFHTKEDALLDSAAPDIHEALKEAKITLQVLQPKGSALLRQIDQALTKVEGKVTMKTWRLDNWNSRFAKDDLKLIMMSDEDIREAIDFLRENLYPKPEDCPWNKCLSFRPTCRAGICQIAVGMCGDF